MPMNQSTDSTSTSRSPITGIAERCREHDDGRAGYAIWAPFDVSSETPRISRRSLIESGVFVACDKTAASERDRERIEVEGIAGRDDEAHVESLCPELESA